MSSNPFINKSMFDQVKGALNKTDDKDTSYKNILSLKKGNTYIVRLLPNTKDLNNTFFHHFVQGWKSIATGQYMSFTSPQTFGDRDPIGEESYRIYKNGTDAEKQKVKNCQLMRLEKWLVNAYIIDDPTSPENNGTVKIIRYGHQLHKIVQSAIDGEDATDVGERMFDLTESGCNLRIKVEEQGEYPSYTMSKFAMPSKIEGMTEANMKKSYESVFDLRNVFTVKSYSELQTILDEHFHCKTSSGSSADKKESPPAGKQDSGIKKDTTKTPPVTPEPVTDESEDADIQALINGLDS